MFNFNRVSRGFVRVYAASEEEMYLDFFSVKKTNQWRVESYIKEYLAEKNLFGSGSVLLFDVLTFPHQMEIYLGGKAVRIFSI